MFIPWKSLLDGREDEDLSGVTTTANVATFPWPIGLPPPGRGKPYKPPFGFSLAKQRDSLKKRKKGSRPIIVGLNMII